MSLMSWNQLSLDFAGARARFSRRLAGQSPTVVSRALPSGPERTPSDERVRENFTAAIKSWRFAISSYRFAGLVGVMGGLCWAGGAPATSWSATFERPGLVDSSWKTAAEIRISDDATRVLNGLKEYLRQSNDPRASEILASLEQAMDPADLITAALEQRYPEYSRAVQASDDDDWEGLQAQLAPFTQQADPYLAADAAFYLARGLMNAERYEAALPWLERLAGEWREYSGQAATIQFYRGQAQAGLLQNAQAVESFLTFLQDHPGAPERLRVSAWRQVQQLQNIQAGQLPDIAQKMDFSRRRLEIADPSESTQTEQDQIVKMLGKLIQEQEKKESSSSNSQKNKQSSQQQQQQQQAGQNPSQNSQSQAGGNSNNPNGKFVEKSFDTGNSSPWSRLREMSRDPANAGIKDKLPARYKEIVERYNDAVNGIDSAKGRNNQR